MKNKKILIRGLSLAVLGVSCLVIGSKPTYKTIDNNNLDERMAVYIKNETGNYEKSNSIPTSGYILNEEKSTCNNNAKPTWNKSNKSLKISNLSNDNTSCYLYFDKQEIMTIEDQIANAKTETPDFSQIADTDEGMYSVSDPVYGGTSYYYRGAVTNNYVKFANFCWRIIRINGDGSIRMIYDGTSCHANGTLTEESIAKTSQAYNLSFNRSEYVGYTWETGVQRTLSETNKSNLKSQIDDWYSEHLVSYDNQIADGKFCNDRGMESGNDDDWGSQLSSTFYYAARGRLESKKEPTLACSSGDIYTLKAGAITADEVSFAGGVYGTANQSYYLYNGQYYWTMTPYGLYWIGGNTRVFIVLNDGRFNCFPGFDSLPGIRPVINLKVDTAFKAGTDGTQNNPYVVEGA